jgi:light-regulated signal transduction histidine kinase (bacteriophytochrome)
LVDETKSTVLWTTVTTMGGLFLALVGFVVVSDRMVFRSHERQIVSAENQLAERKEAQERLAENVRALEISNQELEAFSYSVSHDLRGPLRTIDGFSKALIEDYDDKLDDQGKDFLGRVRAGTQRMGLLIDAMLQMSRASRGDMYREEVDFSEIVSSIASDLQAADPKRKVEFVIAKNVSVVGDQRLLIGVLQNLLSNAWKFTSNHQMAVIEFGTLYLEDKLTYFVRDDGAGFDMEYVHKLFGAFQRLHPTTEFEGTGVGLATAQRIIHRHGGQIWAEGAVDQGATFYFTL